MNAYYLDFYNNKYTLSAESLGELPTKVQSEILIGNRFYNRETNTEVAELGEDFFYNLCFKLTPTVAGNTDGNTNYTVGSYMRGSDVMEKYCKEAFSTIETGKDYSLTSLELSLDGPLTTNAFMGMEFGMYPIFSINKVETKVDPPTPVVQTTSYNVVANYYTSTDGGEYVKDNASEVTLKDATTVNVGDTITATPEDSWMAYNGNKYGLDESKSTLTKVAVLDRATNTLTLNYYRSVKNGSDDPDNNNKHDGGGSSDTPKNNNNGGNGSSTGTATNANTPDTGDSMDLVLWSMLGVTSIALAGVVLALRRKEQN